MQSLVFLTYFFQKLSKKNLWGMGSTLPLVKEGLSENEAENLENVDVHLQVVVRAEILPRNFLQTPRNY